MDISAVLTGMGAGATYSLTSYFKKKDQEFDWLKLGTTLTIGCVAGIVMQIASMDMEAAQEFVVMLGAVPIVENALKITWRKVLAKVLKLD